MALRAAAGRFDCCGKARCERANGLAMWRLPDGTDSMVCPVQLVTETAVEWLDWHAHYRHRLLPVAGGLLDQTGAYLDAMQTIEALIATHQAAQAPRRERIRPPRPGGASRAPRRG